MTGRANPEQLVCAGEFFTDLIFFDLERLPSLGEEHRTGNFAISPGGGAAITAVAAALLGCPTKLVTVWGGSSLEAESRRLLEEKGVSCSWSQMRSDAMSGVTVAVSTRADRYFLTHPGANRFVEQYLLCAETLGHIRRAGHVHFALTTSRWEAFRDVVREFQSKAVTVSWDLGWDPVAGRSRGFRDLCRQLDVLFLNEMEARNYAGVSSTLQALAHFSHSRNIVVIKQGAAGAIASRFAEPAVRARGIDVEAVETTGAGDAFNAGFLAAWLEGKTLAEALQSGNICGGLSTRAPGGTRGLPTQAELEQWRDSLARSGIAGAHQG